jgi:hypothetical protein
MQELNKLKESYLQASDDEDALQPDYLMAQEEPDDQTKRISKAERKARN